MGIDTTSASLARAWDGIAPEQLRARGISKWANLEPCELGAFVAEEDFGAPPCVDEAMRDVVRRGAYGYLPLSMVPDVCQAVAGFAARRFGWQVSPADVRVVPDVMAVLEWTIGQFTTPGSKVLVPTPAYAPFLKVPVQQGREVVQLPMLDVATDPRLDLESLDRALASGDIGLLVLCNPHNPTGHVMSRQEHVDLDKVLARHPHVRVFSDEIHAPITLDGATHRPYAAHSPGAARRTITATSPSKCFGVPGLRAAFAILTNPDDHEAWERLGDRPLRLASTPGIYAAVAAYTEADTWLDALLAYLTQERDEMMGLIAQELPGVVLPRPDGTYISFLDLSGAGLAGPPAEDLRRRSGVVLTDGATSGHGFENWARMVWGTPKPILRQMIQRMGQALRP
ncbi:MAG: MalY/PatB family protein [Galactobacter sp.]